MRFEWDPTKAASNAKKHKITFEVAQTVFYDDFAVQFFELSSSRAAAALNYVSTIVI